MSTDVLLFVATAVFAATALVAAFVTVLAARRTTSDEIPDTEPEPSVAPERHSRAVLVPLTYDHAEALTPRTVEGRVVVPPTGKQVVGAAMSRPQVRLAILAHGLTYALRAESRDRIVALMRREYRRRRRERLAAGRRAVRAAHPRSSAEWTAEPWIGELAATPRTTKVES